jgi:hypothetical protein
MHQPGRLEPTILWVRCCPRCGGIDHRAWFETQNDAMRQSWTCTRCGAHEYRLLKTKW